MIDPEGAEVITSRVETWTDGDYRYTEWLLLPQDRISALGEFSTIGGTGMALDFDGDVGALLAEWKKNQTQLLERFDLNRDRTIDLREWNSRGARHSAKSNGIIRKYAQAVTST